MNKYLRLICYIFFLVFISFFLLLIVIEELNFLIMWLFKKEFLGGFLVVIVLFLCCLIVSYGDMRFWFIVRLRCSDFLKVLILKYYVWGFLVFFFCLVWVWRFFERNLFFLLIWNGEVILYSGIVL